MPRNARTARPPRRGVFSLVHDGFHWFAQRTAEVVGSPWSFAGAILLIVLWGLAGPLFGYSDTWQLVINTGTTIVTFLIVFLIQNTQNRDSLAIHLKLDELIRAVGRARNRLVDVEELTDEELARLQEEFRRLHDHARPAKPT
jgi:low affinity Fe/Cu permease